MRQRRALAWRGGVTKSTHLCPLSKSEWQKDEAAVRIALQMRTVSESKVSRSERKTGWHAWSAAKVGHARSPRGERALKLRRGGSVGRYSAAMVAAGCSVSRMVSSQKITGPRRHRHVRTSSDRSVTLSVACKREGRQDGGATNVGRRR